jgi:hypothetical protein
MFIALVTQLPSTLQSWVNRKQRKELFASFEATEIIYQVGPNSSQNNLPTLLGKTPLAHEMLKILENSKFLLLK